MPMSSASFPAEGITEGRDASPARQARVLVVFESRPSGVAALREAAELSEGDLDLTVVTLAPQSLPARCCARGPSVEVVNCVVREEAERDLLEARAILGSAAARATFKRLVGSHDPPLQAWADEAAFDVIVLPSRRLSVGGHPLARRLRRATSAEIRVVA
jgi:hypothetical protein